MKQKPVVFFTDHLGGGGAARAFKIVTETLAPSRDVRLVLIEEHIVHDKPKDVPLYFLVKRLHGFNLLPALVKYIFVLRRIKPGLVICNNTRAQMLALAARFLARVPTVANIQVDLGAQYRQRPWLLHLLCMLFKAADGFSFISRGIHKNLQDRIPARKPHYFIPNPVDVQEIKSMQAEAVEEDLRAVFNKPVFVNAGRLHEQKGQDILLQAFSRVNSDWNLLILGEGVWQEKLQELAKELQIADRVYFPGFKKNLFALLARSSVFVLASRWEGFANVIVEAMTCGLPVISADCPSGPREILQPGDKSPQFNQRGVEKGRYGLLNRPEDPSALARAMEEMAENEQLRREYAAKSLQRFPDFSKEIVAKAYSDLCDELMT